jgi:low affinity Fe/Cu permease
MNDLFRKFAERTAILAGSPSAFLLALAVVLAWLVSGPIFHFSDTWQLVINTATTIITFLMVFLIQNAQNRDGRAMQIKLDELIRSTTEARNSLIDIEELSDEQLRALQASFRRLSEKNTRNGKDALQEIEEELEERDEEIRGDEPGASAN